MTTKSYAYQLKDILKDPALRGAFEGVLTVQKERFVTRLISCNEFAEIRKIQGSIEVLDSLLSLHTQLQTEERTTR